MPLSVSQNLSAIAVLCILLTACASSSGPAVAEGIPPGMHVVKPLTSGSPSPDAIPAAKTSATDLTIARGQVFSYALPQGWRVGEEG